VTDGIPNVAASGLRLSFSLGSEGEVAIMLNIPERDLMYPVSPYPEIREFIAMLERLEAGQIWRGRHFFGYTFKQDDNTVRFYFRRPSDGVTLGFSSDEWQSLKGLFTKALEMPALQKMFAELSLVYGEI
jgi:hypothetical protein